MASAPCWPAAFPFPVCGCPGGSKVLPGQRSAVLELGAATQTLVHGTRFWCWGTLWALLFASRASWLASVALPSCPQERSGLQPRPPGPFPDTRFWPGVHPLRLGPGEQICLSTPPSPRSPAPLSAGLATSTLRLAQLLSAASGWQEVVSFLKNPGLPLGSHCNSHPGGLISPSKGSSSCSVA